MNRRTLLYGLALGTLCAPLAAVGQQAERMYRIGQLSSTAPSALTEAVRERMRELGWTEGRDLAFEDRYTGPDRERIAAAARELVDLRVDVIWTGGGAETPQAAMTATKTIPIVFAMADDPVRLGLVRTLSRPEANVTGVTSMNAETDSKRLGLLKEVLPKLKRVGVVWSPVDPSGSAVMSAAERAARSLSLQLEPLALRNPEDLSEAFAAAKKHAVEAVMVLGTPILFPHQRRIAELAILTRLATISPWRQLPEAGGLLSYGANLREMFRRVAEILDRILKGAKPSDIPVERPTKFELAINLKTAKTLGLTIPESLLLRADEVIQ
jgi:putative tryptophan/tyrosine transport system substrate-binding protein